MKLDDAKHFSYLKIELHKFQPLEPIVNTKISVFTDDPTKFNNTSILLKLKGERGYGNHVNILTARLLGGGVLFDDKDGDIPLFPVKGSHAWFPFDNLEFNTLIDIEPSLLLGELELVNRINGFIIIGQPKVEHTEQGIILKFRLNRNMFLQVLFGILALVSVLFVLFILTLKSTEELAFSIASFFISLWSIRDIIGHGLDTFPSFLDFWILGLFVILLMGILFKLILKYTSHSRECRHPEG